ncbi:TerC family protein, partial [Bacillus thuringiensis]
IAIAGAAHGRFLLVIIGLLISIPMIICGIKSILILMERFSFLLYFGSAILAYTSGKMVTHIDRFANFFHNNPSFTASIPYLVIF